MEIALIVAASENNVIGDGKNMIWHLSEDLKRFKRLTSGHTILMGRKTYESIGRALPKRRNMVVTRNTTCEIPGCDLFSSIDEAITSAQMMGEDMLFIIGGGEIYRQLWNRADKLYLTLVHSNAVGAITIPDVKQSEWQAVKTEEVAATDEAPAYSFIDYTKR